MNCLQVVELFVIMGPRGQLLGGGPPRRALADLGVATSASSKRSSACSYSTAASDRTHRSRSLAGCALQRGILAGAQPIRDRKLAG
ncbi:hypothetical protein EAS61_21685 [Bradyrhizobium zhanjiangense]|uniref:Uncharacterized protein n=1 Tax=Bradyrhizobium zhanjiangense TaxID=1325107 RepID=A0A4Q0QKC2_9BRAD|nr:hypothetical protein EAS61_21685 [Bradyrhizobium zhanjiangense]